MLERFQDQDVIKIVDGASYALIAPQAGGLLLKWVVDGAPVIYWPEAPDWRDPAAIRGGNPVLFPFLGRHVVDGHTGRWTDADGVTRNMPAHGFARHMPFAATLDADGAGVRLTLRDTPATHAAYPFQFRYEVRYRLQRNALEVTLSTHHTEPPAAPRPAPAPPRMPYYAGHHFYFSVPNALRAETTLSLPPGPRHAVDANGCLSPASAGAARYQLSDARLQDTFQQLPAPCIARLDTPSLERSIEIALDQPGSAPWYALATWAASPQADSFCVEPWLGAPNAIHHGQGLRWLEAGQHEDAICRLTAHFGAAAAGRAAG